MFKFISSAVLASSFALTCGHDASACGRGRCGGRRACATAPAAACDTQPAGPAAPAAMPDMQEMPPAPATAQNGNSQRYRSYSSDTAPASGAPQMRSSGRSYSSPYNQFRADRKMRGLHGVGQAFQPDAVDVRESSSDFKPRIDAFATMSGWKA